MAESENPVHDTKGALQYGVYRKFVGEASSTPLVEEYRKVKAKAHRDIRTVQELAQLHGVSNTSAFTEGWASAANFAPRRQAARRSTPPASRHGGAIYKRFEWGKRPINTYHWLDRAESGQTRPLFRMRRTATPRRRRAPAAGFDCGTVPDHYRAPWWKSKE